MSEKPKTEGAIDLLSHYVPGEVIAKAHELAEQVGREEAIRDYMARHFLLLIAGCLCALAFSVGATTMLFALVGSEFRPLTQEQRGLVWLLGAALALGGFVLLVYPFLRWIKRRALQERASKTA